MENFIESSFQAYLKKQDLDLGSTDIDLLRKTFHAAISVGMGFYPQMTEKQINAVELEALAYMVSGTIAEPIKRAHKQ